MDALPGMPPLGSGDAMLIEPAPGASNVPRNLAAVWIRFPGPISVPEGAFTLTGDAAPVAVAPPTVDSCPDGGVGLCLRLDLQASLGPAATYVVALGAGVEDAQGQPIEAGVLGQFTTSAALDETAPSLKALSVQPSGPCVLISFATDEIAQAEVRLQAATFSKTVSAGAGAMEFSVAASLAGFPAGAAVDVIASAQDRAGNHAEAPTVTLTVPDGLAPIVITEVHANPSGTEPTQEFIEIRNLGADAVDLMGMSIADAKGMDALPSTLLAAGAYALIVASGFDPAGPKDTPPQAGTPLIRVDGKLGSDGLSNSGEVVRLLASTGAVVSSYSAALDVSATAWAGQSVHRIPEDACDQAASWTRRPLPATPGWGAP
ncbi:MAG TPA: lamin tail domain-containing protein [Polyangia bacterium]|nr:lamin tail domain-containing protein [Polyangia bacterium]